MCSEKRQKGRRWESVDRVKGSSWKGDAVHRVVPSGGVMR